MFSDPASGDLDISTPGCQDKATVSLWTIEQKLQISVDKERKLHILCSWGYLNKRYKFLFTKTKKVAHTLD